MKLDRKSIVTAVLLMIVLSLSAKATVSFKLSPDSLKPGDKGTINAIMTIPDDMHQSYIPGDNDFFYLTATAKNLDFGKTRYPQPDHKSEDGEWIYDKKVTLTLPFTVKKDTKAGKIPIDIEFGYNNCFESGLCEPPETVTKQLAIMVAGVPETVEEADSIAAILPEVQESIPEPVQESEPKSAAGDIWKYLLMAFLGGLILNVTPCVLPILPIRIMKIINQSKTDDSKVLNHVFLYTFGVLISFGIMAAIIIGLQQAGESVGWGLQNQNPGFVIALMCIVFAFALSLLGVFEIHLPGMSSVSQVSSKSGYSGSFFGGIFAFLMAISCTGPFLGLALPFALNLPPLFLLSFFLIIGLGFSFPFILIGFFKGALKLIPKPGNWMVIFKQLMGFVLLWIVYTQIKTLTVLTDTDYFLKVLWFMLILGFSIWLYGRFVRFENSKATQWIFTILPVLLIVAAAFTYLPLDTAKQTTQDTNVEGLVSSPHAPEGWYVFSEELLTKTLQEGRPVFLDIGAEWCKNCKANEKTVLFTESMMKEFASKNVLLLKADFTRKDEKILAWIINHERAGVPFNALYVPNQKPIVFNELITRSEISNALSTIPE